MTDKAEEKQQKEGAEQIEASRMPFMAHLVELRKRMVAAAIAVGVGFGIAFPFKEYLLAFMVEPLKAVLPEGQRLIYTNLPEAFFTYLKISFLTGTLLALPVIFWQLWSFIAPGLYKNEKRYAVGFVISSTLLFFGGAIFGYQIVFPYGFTFFVGFESELIQPLPALNQYFSFSLRLLIAFGVIFELPIVVFFLSRMGIVDHKWLRKHYKWAILLTFVVGAMFTPPDVVTQVLMAAPLIILFEISIWVSRIFGKKKPEPEPEEEDEPETTPPATTD